MNPDRITSGSPPEEQRRGGADPQTRTLHLTTLLTALRPDWAGSLILSFGLSPTGSALALAANIAGATCLSIDPSPDNCRDALRHGAVDFMVNSLDEALRALKNEIRKGHPLSVALETDPRAASVEILERGLLPELLTLFPSSPAAPALPSLRETAQALANFGTTILDLDGSLDQLPSATEGWSLLDRYTTERSLSLQTFSFESSTALRSFDAKLLDLIPAPDTRRRWLVGATRSFSRREPGEPRLFRRSAYLTTAEHEVLSPAVTAYP